MSSTSIKTTFNGWYPINPSHRWSGIMQCNREWGNSPSPAKSVPKGGPSGTDWGRGVWKAWEKRRGKSRLSRSLLMQCWISPNILVMDQSLRVSVQTSVQRHRLSYDGRTCNAKHIYSPVDSLNTLDSRIGFLINLSSTLPGKSKP